MKLLLLVIALVGIASAKILTPSDQSRIIPGKYIIRLKDGVDAQKFIRSTSLRKQDGTLSALNDNTGYVYSNVFSGFSASLDETELKELDKSPEVMYIEPDGIATVQGQEQAGATWGLARSSSRTILSGSSHTYFFKSSAGNGVTAYVIDTGVNIAHTEFAGRAAYGYNAITGETDADGNGHGTHVAGTVGGSVYGIAKRCNIVSVKVLSSGGSGSWAGVTAGIDWVTANARPANRAVINMSLGGGATQSVDDAVAAAVAAGVTSVVAAGNSNANACNYSPARVPSAITVAASDINDRSASFTNYGSCTDLYAAGVSITSAWIGSNTATNTISGTSMASPHVAGVAALIISQYQTNSPAEVEAQLKAYATSNAISGVPTSDTPNVLLYNGGN